MIDAHSHLGQYENPKAIADQLPTSMVILAVTSTPGEFERLRPLVGRHHQVRLAVGMHPAIAGKISARDLRAFDEALLSTSYIGEVGLDFALPRASWPQQEKVFGHALRRATGKVLSLHAVRAESRIEELLHECPASGAIFHWYTGSLATLDRLIKSGYFFSIGPATIRSARGRKIASRIPPDRLLVETDGPFVRLGGRPLTPDDAQLAYEALAGEWGAPVAQVVSRVRQNFSVLVRRAKEDSGRRLNVSQPELRVGKGQPPASSVD